MDKATLRDLLVQVLQDGGLEDLGLWLSTYHGFVEDDDDPDGLRRVKVRVPEVSSRPLKEWALPKMGNMGPNQGFDFTPIKGAKVWVEFRMGDINRPIYLPGPDSKKNGLQGASPKVRRIRSAKGEISINDETGIIKVQAIGQDEMLELTPGALAVLAGALVDLGTKGLTPLDGVVTGMCKCMYTGAPHIEVSLVVRAKK